MQLRETLHHHLRRGALPLLGGVTVLALTASTAAGAASGTDDDDSGSGSAEAFVSCMRSNGVADFRDVTVTEDGRIELDDDEAGIDPFDATYQAALAACGSELPAGSDLPDDPDLAAPSAPADLTDPETGDACLPPPSPSAPS